jgi:hypothetical protein
MFEANISGEIGKLEKLRRLGKGMRLYKPI